MHPDRDLAGRETLRDIIRQARRRWRAKVVLRGLAALVLGGLALVGGSILALEYLRFAPLAVIALRIVAIVGLAGLVAWFLVRPFLRRVSDEQMALYLEELEPSFDATVVSAVDAIERPSRDAATSPALIERLVAAAVARYEQQPSVQAAERGPVGRYVATIATLAAAGAALLIFGPEYVRYGARALFQFSRDVQAASPYRLDVTPGDATVPRGADQEISATLTGFQSERVELVMRKGDQAAHERVPLIPAEEGARYEGILFDLSASTQYFVEAGGVRSPTFTLKVVDLPYVERLELEYHFPAYTGLAPQKVDNGGDIAVIAGTEVRLRVKPTLPTPAGRVKLHESSEAPLRVEPDGTLTGTFKVDREGFYRIELDGPAGERVAASPQYAIDVLADQAPSVSFAKPGRDTTASPIEEVFVEAQATDDFGLRQLDLVYSVNGGPEKDVRLFSGSGEDGSRTEVSAGHTFYLEELDLKPGDFVSYYARVADNDIVHGPKRASSDLYFMQIRPFRKDFRPAPSQAGGAGMGGAGGAQVGALSQQQRQIISATFNLVRDRQTYTAEKFRENVVMLALAQGRLREQVEGLVGRMGSRLVEPDPAFQKIAEILPKAVEEMKAAETKLRGLTPDEALSPEQRALQHLQKAEEEYEVQITTQQGGGGGGGGAGSIAEDLADLFELETDRLANQYEMAQRAEQQQRDQQLDALMERLRELARRQEQELERQRRRARAQAGGPSGGGSSQRALADEVEEAARRLERLSREEQRPDLAEAARRMQEAADAMRRAAANGDAGGAAQAGAALDRLREAERRLNREQTARAGRDVEAALRTAQELAEKQREIAKDVEGLGQGTSPNREQLERIAGRKEQLEQGVAELEQRLDRTAAEVRRDEREASDKLREGAEAIRQGKIKEKIRYTRGLLRSGNPQSGRAFEEDIGANLDRLRDTLSEAMAAVGKSGGDRMAEALDRARDIARGVDSMGERLRERGQRNQDSQSARGQQGQEGGQQGGQGQQGQQGASGEQGQGGQEGTAGGRADARGDGRAGDGATYGPWGGGWGGWDDRRPWAISGEDIRQFRGEVREWSSEVTELRRQLSNMGVETADLDEILKALRALDSERVYKDAEELARLQSFVAEGMKRFEYDLRRKLNTDNEQILLSGREDVPPQFRDLVEEYYRSLSRRRAAR